MKHIYLCLWYPLFQAQLVRCNQHYHQTLLSRFSREVTLWRLPHTVNLFTISAFWIMSANIIFEGCMIVKHEHVVWRSFGIKDEEFDILSQCWIPKPHQWPYKQCYIAASVRCSTKPDFKLLTYILSVVKTSIKLNWLDVISIITKLYYLVFLEKSPCDVCLTRTKEQVE
jgi:hypothetical protein